MVAHRKHGVIAEGWGALALVAFVGAIVVRTFGWIWALPFVLVLFFLVLLFRDPARRIPPLPRAVVAPVDGRIVAVNTVQDGQLPGRWLRVKIRANPWGAYTVRSPIEGAVMDLRERTGVNSVRGLWVCSEEDDDVVLLFPRRESLVLPKAFVRYGERLGQGQRFAYLRLSFAALLYLPRDASLRVGVGDRIRAGCDVVADLADT